jgi:hypothetical protein
VSEPTWLELPDIVSEPFDVYINGVLQHPGIDYEQVGRSLRFPRPLAHEGKLGVWRWLAIFFGIAGSYRKHETVDIAYQSGGQRQVAPGLRPTPDTTDPSSP